MDHWIGIDLGSHVDFSAVSVLVRTLAIHRETRRPLRDSAGNALYDWRLRALARFPLRTPYPTIARKVAGIALDPAVGPSPRVVVDSTGVGIAVLELIRTALAGRDVEVWGLSITAGENWKVVRRYEINCSKVQLVSSFAAVLHSGRFRVCRKEDGRPIDGAEVLEKELAAFKVRQSRRSDAEIFGADAGKHDDAVLCASVPIFAGGLPFMRMQESADGADDPRLPPREADALAAEVEAIRLAEAEAILREQGRENERMRAARLEREARITACGWDDDELWESMS